MNHTVDLGVIDILMRVIPNTHWSFDLWNFRNRCLSRTHKHLKLFGISTQLSPANPFPLHSIHIRLICSNERLAVFQRNHGPHIILSSSKGGDQIIIYWYYIACQILNNVVSCIYTYNSRRNLVLHRTVYEKRIKNMYARIVTIYAFSQ